MTNQRAVAVIKRDNKILCIHRHKNGQEYYVFPGGSVEAGESYEQALKREVLEETGFTISKSTFLFELQNQGRTEHWFDVTVTETTEPTLGGPEINRQSPENSYEFVWLTAEQLKSLPNIHPTEAVNKFTFFQSTQ